MKEYIVDAIDGEVVRCEQEDGTFVTLPLMLLPEDAREGDCLTEQDGILSIDAARTEQRRARMAIHLRRRLPPEG